MASAPTDNERQDVTIVTVTFNSAKILGRMLRSVPGAVPLIVVDNASDDVDEVQKILNDRPNSTLLRNDENLGFGAACNRGSDHSQTRFLLFLNPDATLDEGAIGALRRAADTHPDASAFNPAMYDDKGHSVLRRRSPLVPRARWISRETPADDIELPALSGAAIFVEASKFRSVGGFDERIFLYHEDDDLSLRLAARFGPLRLINAARASHLGGASVERTPNSAAWKAWHMGQSRVYALGKHARPAPFTRSLILAASKFLAPDILYSRRRRAKNLGFLKGVLSTRFNRVPFPSMPNPQR